MFVRDDLEPGLADALCAAENGWKGLNPPYATIVADPPWHPTMRGKAHPARRYSTLSFSGIRSLPVHELAAEQSHLYLWALTAHIDAACRTVGDWGFEPVTMFTWCKPGLGSGRFRCNTEHVIVARRGSAAGNPFGRMGQTGQATAGTWFNWPRGTHSQKPAAFFDLVEAISPGPYVELFAREQRFGWDSWGYGQETRLTERRGEFTSDDDVPSWSDGTKYTR